MQPGDLRRFKDSFRAVAAEHLRGCTFMVLEVIMQGPYAAKVNILVENGVQLDWGYRWVKDSSEVLDGVE